MANPTVPDFTDVAARKLADLLEKGFVITGYCFERQVEGTQPQRGFVDFAGFVGWHQPSAAKVAPTKTLSCLWNLHQETIDERMAADPGGVRSLGNESWRSWDHWVAAWRLAEVHHGITAHGVADMKGDGEC